VKQVVQGQKQMEGAGVRICRTIGTGALRNLDPFLMLDELKMPPNEATAGFPDHPHRGFETCSIMLSGKMEHSDHVGNHGVIGAGGVQWMTAGRGIVHSEMPVVTDDKYLHRFQLWINLPKKHKMVKPRYQDYQADEIPTVEKGGVRVRVMAGESYGAVGPIKMRNPGMLLDVHVAEGATFSQPVPESYNGFCYVYEGAGKIGGAKARPEQNLVMGAGDKVVAEGGSGGIKFLLVAGQPIGEPIVQYGPFVMNTQAEIQQAFMDFQTGKLQNPEDDVWGDGD
jgi:redox-sensitive bicupin YhaK (pirin superfamily)